MAARYFPRPTRAMKMDVWARDNFTCRYCGVHVFVPHHRTSAQGRQDDPQLATVDHIIPVSAGGRNTKKNMVTACYQCNQIRATQRVREQNGALVISGSTGDCHGSHTMMYAFHNVRKMSNAS